MIENRVFSPKRGGIRLDAALLLEFPGTTRALCREACAEGLIKVNGRSAGKGTKIGPGDNVEIISLAEECDNRIAPNRAIEVECVFEDDALLAFNKPPALPVQPLSRRETRTLMNGVVARWPETAETGDAPLMGGALHRIDADTSGLVLVARTREAYESMRAQFAAQTVEKTYLALVEGSVATGGTLENELVHDPTVPFCRMVDARRCRFPVKSAPMRAVTKYTPVLHASRGCQELTLLEVVIRTGVTHQIRAQLAMAGMHIVNDRLYGAFAEEKMRGHCLHAMSARFEHPTSRNGTELRTPYPTWADGRITRP